MIPLVKLPEGRVCEYFARFMKEPTLTYEGLDIHSEESKSSMGEFEKLILLNEDYSAKILDAREILNEIHRRSNNSCVIIDDGNIYE